MSTIPAIEIRALSVSYQSGGGVVPALRSVDLALDHGRTLAILGESGSGKSTLCRALLGLLPKEAIVVDGQIRVYQHEVGQRDGPSMRGFRGRTAAYIPQDVGAALNPVFRVGKQVTTAARFALGMATREAQRRMLAVFEEVGLPEPEKFAELYPHQLSLGARQRVLIAMALAPEPRLLIADEPTSSVDAVRKGQIIDVLRGVRQRRELTMVIVTHDIHLVSHLADDVAVLLGGQLVEHSAASQFLAAPLHPYSQYLLASTPERISETASNAGSPEQVNAKAAACPYSQRCREAQEICSERFPQESIWPEGRRVWCYARERSAT